MNGDSSQATEERNTQESSEGHDGSDRLKHNASTILRVLNSDKLSSREISQAAGLGLKDTQDTISYLWGRHLIAPTSDGFQCLYYATGQSSPLAERF
jgi:hypothetical protein